MLRKFLKEERGQGAIEYIMLAGGIIVAAIIIFVIYRQASSTAGQKINESIKAAAQKESERISEELAKL